MPTPQLRDNQLPKQRCRARASRLLPIPAGRMVPFLNSRSSRRHALLHRAGALGVHLTPVNGLVRGTVCALPDLAKCHGLVRACERIGQVLFVESDCQNLRDLADDVIISMYI